MTRYCPKCKKEIDKKVFGLSEFCPDCGTQTIEKDSSFSLNLGDADAISGGIHNTDSHNVDSHEVHTTTHNTTNNVTNYVQQVAKNAEEAAIEKKFQFRQYCEKIVQKGGLISAEGKVLLDRKMAELGLSQDEGDAVVLSVKQSKIRSSSELNLLAKIKLDSAKLAIKQNSQNLRKSLSELKAQCLIYDNEELHFYYNLLLSALDAKQCIVRYEGRKADSYWMAFWAYLAYIKMGDCEMAEQTIAGLSTFEEMPQGNLILLDTVGRISDIIDNDDAKESQLSLLNEVSGDCSDLLTDFKQSLVDICSDKMEKPDFFAKHFSGIDFAAREEAEKKRKAEAEQKAKEEAERRAREEAERIAREVAERKAREEAERKAREEAERKAREEVERKAREEAERQRKAEAERRAKEEAERKAREEAKRIAREEAEREAREEAERLAREEAEKKREEEAERKAIEEAQRKAREEAERLAREEAEKKRKEEAERKAREKAEQKAREEYDKKQAPYSVVIDKVNDSFAAMITARSVFGWGSADFRKKTASLPFVNTPVDGKINAEKISSTLNKGGFSSHIEKAQGENGLNEETSTEPVPLQ